MVFFQFSFENNFFTISFALVFQINELDEEPEALNMEWPKSCRKRVSYVLVAPILVPLWLTLPDTRTPRGDYAKLFIAHIDSSCLNALVGFYFRKEIFPHNISGINMLDSRLFVSYGLVGKRYWWHSRNTPWGLYQTFFSPFPFLFFFILSLRLFYFST